MTNPTAPWIEAAARALCAAAGYDPNGDSITPVNNSEMDVNWKVYAPDAEIAIKAADKAAWLPIESAPKDRTKVLLTDGKEVSQGWYDEWDRTFVRHDEAQAGDGFSVHYDEWESTHWQPLPNPPQGK